MKIIYFDLFFEDFNWAICLKDFFPSKVYKDLGYFVTNHRFPNHFYQKRM